MEKFAEERLEICKKCPLWYEDPEFGPRCNGKKYISPDGKEASFFKHDGWHKGCNCLLKIKTQGVTNHCIIKKW